MTDLLLPQNLSYGRELLDYARVIKESSTEMSNAVAQLYHDWSQNIARVQWLKKVEDRKCHEIIINQHSVK